MIIDKAREYVVIVNGGSGCIFQPSDQNSTYILTANHNIQNTSERIEGLTRFTIDENHIWHKHEIPFEETIEGINYFPHLTLDIAILKMVRLEGFDRFFRFRNIEEDRNDFFLLGYPETRRNLNNDKITWYRPDPGVEVLGTTHSQRREAQVPGNPGLEEVKGNSGGCIVKIIGDNLYLAGIQNSMAQAEGEQLGRVEFTPIEVFDEIINLFPNQLSPLYPSYLRSFDFLRSNAFDLDDVVLYNLKISHVKNYLQHKCQEVIQNEFTPTGIKSFFQTRLLIDPTKKEELESKNIWIIWLEFLTVLNIVKDCIHTVDDLSTLFDNYRLLFSDTKEDWCHEIPKLVYSDYKGLKRNGTVIIGVEKSPLSETYILDKKLVMIGDARGTQDRDKLKIDDGLGFPFDEFKFIHIEYFKRETIIKRHQEYAETENDDETLLAKLKELYEGVFKS